MQNLHLVTAGQRFSEYISLGYLVLSISSIDQISGAPRPVQPRNAFSLSSPLHRAFCIASTNTLNVFHSQLLGNEANDQRSMVNGKLAGTGLGSESLIVQFSMKLATANKMMEFVDHKLNFTPPRVSSLSRSWKRGGLASREPVRSHVHRTLSR